MFKLRTTRHISEINRGKSSSGSKLITNLTMLHVSTSPAPAIHRQQLATLQFLSENSCHSQKQILWNETIYCMMKQKVFKIIIKHSRTSMQDMPAQKVDQAIKNSLAIDLRRVTAFRKAGRIFLQLTTISRFVVCGLHILLSSARMYLIYVIFLCRTSLNLCPLMCCVEPKRIASSLH